MHELIPLIREAVDIDLPFEPDTPLISSGMIDSFRMAALVTALESHYGIHIDLTQIGVDNFDTAQQMYLFIRTHV
ncbi:MAG TPA: acyl carrier protein [Candidatus Tectomicrobia bacterium]|nr:acyl carrier protein [Candidatus Tectomicrobia bacterium]